MNPEILLIDKLTTERLTLIPFTIEVCEHIIKDDFTNIFKMGYKKGKSWPDNDVLETLPKIIKNLLKVKSPTGFESWMVIKSDTMEIIGDIGFKGFNNEEENIDLGYGIIKEERRKGYAEEASKILISWAFSKELIKEITASCLSDNFSSINLLKKLNFTIKKRQEDMIFWTLTSATLSPSS